MVFKVLKYLSKSNFSQLKKSKSIMSKRDKPVWMEPINENASSSLKVFNSLSNQKDIFKPREGNKVQWYSCGPTVYDVSHMGHARTYISIDIIRRIMRDYLKYDVHYVMNITDVDDKIIKRARQNYLFAKYKSDSINKKAQIKEDLKNVLVYYENKITKEKDVDMAIMLNREKEGVSRLLHQESIEEGDLTKIQDAMSTWLDSIFGHTVCDNSIFEDLPRLFEKMFMVDMNELNIMPPDELTRVSEYIQNIIEFVAKIINRELAYESNGSVYFDTEKFDNHEDHYYAKLVPTAFGNESLLQEGEGALSSNEVGDKRSKNDFALWKSSKPGEPSWDSPWGKGRPGWHIECSAMAGDKCGSHLDIHTGGVDLKFPHHDNEIAQSEAYFGCKQWVNYFLHTGHLTIAGCKMSKSLKNFISIKDALSRHTSRQLRLAFLLSSWKDTLDYSDDLMTSAIVYEKMLLDFFFTVRHIINFKRDPSVVNSEKLSELPEILAKAREQFHSSICDSFDTRGCMVALKKLVEDTNKHCMERRVLTADVNGLREISEYVCSMMRMFGASETGTSLDLVQYTDGQLRSTVQKVLHLVKRFHENLHSSSDETNLVIVDKIYEDFLESLKTHCNLSVDDIISEDVIYSRDEVEVLLQVVSQWRQEVRATSRTNKWKKFLAVCDDLRDNGLKEIGVRLHDTEEDIPSVGLYPVWAFDDKKVAKDKGAATQNKKPAGDAKVKLGVDVAPEVMFTQGPHQGQFSAYDDQGLPTHDVSGTELSKNRRTKLKKLQDEQRKKFVAASQ